ncbi:hypothetical protein ABGB12_15825 [Actinocorallia sp. B10E7]|uniref:hypothetical protein n=1 Tax=Actinocorallia sp. B10E7 TaxID=3153558 RepID=UPI00325E1DA2
MSGYALPRSGEVFFDARGEDRALRLSWHPDVDLMVFSLWDRGTCTATFRLPAAELGGLIEMLSHGLPQGGPPDPGPETTPDLVPGQGEEVPLTGQHRHPG